MRQRKQRAKVREGMRFGGSESVVTRENWAGVVADSKPKRKERKREGILLGKSQIPAYPGFAESEVYAKGTDAGRQLKILSSPVEDCEMQTTLD